MSAIIASRSGPFALAETASARARSPQPHTRRRRQDRALFQLIVVATFPAFYVAAFAVRLIPVGRAPESGRPRPSIFREATAAARTCGSFALMG